jgi:truncated hemoglobin YjbI
LFQRVGGTEGFTQLVEKFYKKVTEDEDLMEKYFKGANVKSIIDNQFKYIASKCGGK